MRESRPPIVTATEIDAPRQRPRRPALIELVAALLVVAGVLGLISLFAPDPRRPEGLEGLAALAVALSLGQVVVGVLIRMGRLWLLDVNFVAVLGFLDLGGASGSSLALLLGIVELGSLAVLFVYRSWFDGRWAQPTG